MRSIDVLSQLFVLFAQVPHEESSSERARHFAKPYSPERVAHSQLQDIQSELRRTSSIIQSRFEPLDSSFGGLGDFSSVLSGLSGQIEEECSGSVSPNHFQELLVRIESLEGVGGPRNSGFGHDMESDISHIGCTNIENLCNSQDEFEPSIQSFAVIP